MSIYFATNTAMDPVELQHQLSVTPPVNLISPLTPVCCLWLCLPTADGIHSPYSKCHFILFQCHPFLTMLMLIKHQKCFFFSQVVAFYHYHSFPIIPYLDFLSLEINRGTARWQHAFAQLTNIFKSYRHSSLIKCAVVF